MSIMSRGPLQKLLVFDWRTALMEIILLDAHDTEGTGGRLNKKDGLTRYGDSHVKDKTS